MARVAGIGMSIGTVFGSLIIGYAQACNCDFGAISHVHSHMYLIVYIVAIRIWLFIQYNYSYTCIMNVSIYVKAETDIQISRISIGNLADTYPAG